MKTTLAALLLLATVAQAAAQTAIEVRPRGRDLTIDNSYVGPYGRDLPGVALFRGMTAPGAVTFGQVKTPSYQKIENEQVYSQSQLPFLDSWHGTQGGGFEF